MLSFQAISVLRELVYRGTNISADTLAEKYGENRKYFLRSLKELRDAGLISTRKERIGSAFMTVSVITEDGFRVARESFVGSPDMGLLISQNTNNPYIYSIKDKPNRSAEPIGEDYGILEVEVKNMGYEFFEPTSSDKDERVAELSKARAAKQVAYEEAKSKKAKSRFISRKEIDPKDWSPSDTCFEFADRIHQYWHVKPWSLTQSRFVPSLAEARKKHATDGEVEVRMMDAFFASINMDKYDDAEHLWRLFIKRFPEFVMPAKRSMIPEELSEEEARLQEKSLERFFGNV